MSRLALVGLLVTSLSYGTAQADPVLVQVVPTSSLVHLHSQRKACLDPDPVPTSCVPLGPGYFLDEPTFDKLDQEVHRLQDSETRLTAENKSLRTSAASWQPGWMSVLSVAIGAAALTLYVEHKL